MVILVVEECYSPVDIDGDGVTSEVIPFDFAGNARFADDLDTEDKLVFVGSFNLDPRSVALHTEVGVLFESMF